MRRSYFKIYKNTKRYADRIFYPILGHTSHLPVTKYHNIPYTHIILKYIRQKLFTY